ncbi:hypothetical protein SLS54_009879 [Diplodia seriata]
MLKQSKLSFLTNLLLNDATEATLAHDMVYSLIGISTEFAEPSSFEVDYSKPVEDVYIETTRFILQSRMDLELLSASPKVLQRAFFRTKNQHIGLGPNWAQKQDEIWLIQGAKMPIVLRPLPNGHYIWIGEAYIEGIMYGEAIPFAEESREIVIE